MRHKKWVLLSVTVGLILILAIWQWPTISLYITLNKQPQISTAQLQKLWDEYQASFSSPPPAEQNRFLVTTKIAEELGTVIEGWKQSPASQDVWQDAIYPLIPHPPTGDTQLSPKFGAEETLLSQVQPLLDRYLTTSSFPNAAPPPSTLGKPVDNTRDFRILDLTKLALVKCSHLFATGHNSEIWPLLDTNLKLASTLTTHPATLLDYVVGTSVRDDTLIWLGHALQAQPTLLDTATMRDAISLAKQPHAMARQVLLAELADAISTAPDVLNTAGDMDVTRQIERKAIFGSILDVLDHPDAPCASQSKDILDTCKILDKYRKYTQEDTTTIAGMSLLLDILNTHQQSGHWPSTLEGTSAQMFEYTLDESGFILKTNEEYPRTLSAPLATLEATQTTAEAIPPTPAPPPPPDRPIHYSELINGLKKPDQIEKRSLTLQTVSNDEAYSLIRVVPFFSDGQAHCCKILSVKEGSLFDKMGLRRGDYWLTTNNREHNLSSGLPIVSELAKAPQPNIGMYRDGNTLQINYTLTK